MTGNQVHVSAVGRAKRVLMVAYHFPPLAGSSGIQRTLRFVQHLPACGWQPLVLSAAPQAYERVSADLDAEVPPGTVVRRAWALDNARHLSLFGRHLGALGRPDRWVSWRFAAVPLGLRMIRKFRPDVIWSTFPLATAHLIAAALHRRSGLPWIADFRDPMAQEGYPADPKTRAQYQAIEATCIREATLNVFTTPGAARVYRERYPAAGARVEVLENGYDEESFVAAGRQGMAGQGPLQPGQLTLLHSGIVYPQERDPTQLFAALRELADSGEFPPGRLRLRFRASVHDALLHRLAAEHGVQAHVEVCPPLPYQQALAEMLRADGLLLMQASSCNEQIPAKLYEYLRAGRPVVCLTDPRGDTAAALHAAGIDSVARLDRADEIRALLRRLLASDTDGLCARPDAVAAASRAGRTAQLARQLDALVQGRGR